MFDLKIMNPKAATKLVTLVTILGLASGCVHEQVKNDDPAMDLPALTLNDPAPESKGEMTDDLNLDANATSGADSVADSSGIDTSLPAESSSMPLADESSAPVLSDSSMPADTSANLAYSTPSDLTPLAGSMMDDSASKPAKKAKKGKHRKSKIAKHGKRKSMKVAGGKKSTKNRKNIAKKANKDVAPVVAAIEPTQMPPTGPSADALTIDGAPMDATADTTTTAATTSAPTDSAMTLPADSEIGMQETTTIEPPLALSQAPEISTDDSSIWIYWGGGMMILVGAIVLFVKRRRTAIRY